MDLEALYTRFRRSRLFLIVLVVVVSLWLTAHYVFGLDPDFGGLNLALSVEATMAGAILYIALKRSERLQAEQLKYIADMSAAIRELLQNHINAHTEEHT